MDIKFLKNKKFLIITTCCLLFVICVFFIWYQLKVPLSKNTEGKIFIVEEAQGLKEIATNLKVGKIIRSKWVFTFYVWLRSNAKNLQAGKYSLNSSMDILEVAKRIINGDIVPMGIKVTIPEGFSNKQIEDRLVSFEIISQDDKFLQELEGYLFPDTYYFEKDSSIEEVIKKMRDNFDKKVEKDLKPETLIMASIIEKEVISDEDRAIVSGIFWQRLKDNYPLESCATIAYILGIDKWRYSIEDTRIESPYNTYMNIGLPPTPINNPGLSAIRAATNPEISDYYFFLTAPDGTTVFSKTFKEHSANKRKYFEPDSNLILQ